MEQGGDVAPEQEKCRCSIGWVLFAVSGSISAHTVCVCVGGGGQGRVQLCCAQCRLGLPGSPLAVWLSQSCP
jgi:hypothetical protein